MSKASELLGKINEEVDPTSVVEKFLSGLKYKPFTNFADDAGSLISRLERAGYTIIKKK